LIEEDGKVGQNDNGQYGSMFGMKLFAAGASRRLGRGLLTARGVAGAASERSFLIWYIG
jgi:hypothetical protein